MLGWSEGGSAVILLSTQPEIELEEFKMKKMGGDFAEEAMWSEKVSRIKELNAAMRSES